MTPIRPDIKGFDDKPGAWFKRGFFVGLGLLAAMPAAFLMTVLIAAFLGQLGS